MSSDSDFKTISTAIKSVNNVSQEDKLLLYGLYKTITCGPINIPEPSLFNLESNYKYNAWKNCSIYDTKKATKLYIKIANKYLKK